MGRHTQTAAARARGQTNQQPKTTVRAGQFARATKRATKKIDARASGVAKQAGCTIGSTA